jgi:DNA-binding transcriptional MocR family regulator
MLIRLSNTSPQPLREQIVRRLRELILRGELPEHTQLPSIRVLAHQLRVGVVTVQRARPGLTPRSSEAPGRTGAYRTVARGPSDGAFRKGDPGDRAQRTQRK